MNFKIVMITIIIIFSFLILSTMFIYSTRGAITFVDSANGSYQIRLRGVNYLGDDTMNEIYNADLATVTPLQTRTGVAIKDSSYQTFTRDMRIADSKGFNYNQFTLRVYNKVGTLTTASIIVNCTMFNGTKVQRNVTFTAVGTYNILTNGEVVVFSNTSRVTKISGIGLSFSYQINQSRFGCVRKNQRSYVLDNAWLNIGQSAISVSALFQRCQIYFNNSHENYAGVSFIQVAGATSDLTFSNVSMFLRINKSWYPSSVFYISFSGRTLSYKNLSYDANCNTITELGTSARKLYAYDCLLKNMAIYNGNLTMDNVIMYNVSGTTYAMYNNIMYSINDLILKKFVYGVAFFGSFNLSGVRFSQNTYVGVPVIFSGSIYLIDCTSDAWAMSSGVWTTGKVRRSNSLYMRTVVNGTSVNLSGVTVVIKNVTGVTKSTLTTDVSGLISRQILDYYTWTNYNIGYFDSPYTIYLSKSGYQNEVFKVSMGSIVNLTVPMIVNITIPSTSLTLYQNLVNASGTHQSQYNILTGWKVWANHTGITTPIHQFQNIIRATGTHHYLLNSTGYWDWANYTGNVSGLVAIQNIVNAIGTHDYQFRSLLGVNGEWWVWANYTGTLPPPIITINYGSNLTVDNPNPGNGTHLTNYIATNNPITTSVDIINKNFTILDEIHHGIGKLYEYHEGTHNMRTAIRNDQVHGQTFKIGCVGDNDYFLLHKVKVYLKRTGTPNIIYFYINNVKYYTNMLGFDHWFPGNETYSFGSIDGNIISTIGDYYYINMTTFLMKPDTNYTLIVKVLHSSGAGNHISWAFDDVTGDYSQGDFCVSSDNGTYPNWDREDGQDFIFYVYGWGLNTNITWNNLLNLTFYSNTSGIWSKYGNTIICTQNGTYEVPNYNFTNDTTQYWWNTSLTGIFTFTTIDGGNWLFMAGFNINEFFMILSVFAVLLYFWFKSENIYLTMALAMLIVPYDFVAIILYVLPSYITNTSILLFMQMIFIAAAIIILGFTIDIIDKKRHKK